MCVLIDYLNLISVTQQIDKIKLNMYRLNPNVVVFICRQIIKIVKIHINYN